MGYGFCLCGKCVILILLFSCESQEILLISADVNMDSKTPNNSEIASNLRNLAISRRGGVRTRGGRLPPISMREMTQVTGNKKVVAPNIPQRRKVIKKEVETRKEPLIKIEKIDQFQNSKGRGRGRQQKVFLQMEGAFLAEGPVAKLKRDPLYDESFSISRIARKTASEGCGEKVDAEIIKDLLESYEASEAYEDDFGIKNPYRLPLQKEKLIHKIKLEPDEDVIKKEFKEAIEMGIKTEIEDEELTSPKGKITHKVEIHSKTEVKPTAEEFKNAKDDGILILLQLPQLSAALKTEITEGISKDKQPEKQSEQKVTSTFIDSLEEGFIGKLQIMKSGRMKIVLGSSEFELFDGNRSESYREAVSIQIHENEGDLAIVGKIDRTMILSPMINSLIMNNV